MGSKVAWGRAERSLDVGFFFSLREKDLGQLFSRCNPSGFGEGVVCWLFLHGSFHLESQKKTCGARDFPMEIHLYQKKACCYFPKIQLAEKEVWISEMCFVRGLRGRGQQHSILGGAVGGHGLRGAVGPALL